MRSGNLSMSGFRLGMEWQIEFASINALGATLPLVSPMWWIKTSAWPPSSVKNNEPQSIPTLGAASIRSGPWSFQRKLLSVLPVGFWALNVKEVIAVVSMIC